MKKKPRWIGPKKYRVRRGISWHEEVIEFVVKVLEIESKALSGYELYRRFTIGRQGYMERIRFSGILSDETLRVTQTPRIERILHGVYRKGGTKVESVPKNFEQKQLGDFKSDPGRRGEQPMAQVKEKNTRKRRAQFYTPAELRAYAKANGLSEADIAESIEWRRVGVGRFGNGSGFDEM